MPNFRANGLAVAERNADKQTNRQTWRNMMSDKANILRSTSNFLLSQFFLDLFLDCDVVNVTHNSTCDYGVI